MRFWRPLEDTPAWLGSRAAQGCYALVLVLMAAGLIAAITARVEEPWVRIAGAVIVGVGVLMVFALLVRSERVRRHHREKGPARDRGAA